MHPHSLLTIAALLVMLSEPFTKYRILFELVLRDRRGFVRIRNHKFDLVSGLDF